MCSSDDSSLVCSAQAMSVRAVVLVAAAGLGACLSGEQVVYGKYFDRNGDDSDNSFWLFKPVGSGPFPAALQFHPGGLVGGSPTKEPDAEVEAYVGAGIAYLSVGYRLTTTKYFYGLENHTEELVHVSEQGLTTLDDSLTMDAYVTRRGRQEHVTKYAHDLGVLMHYLAKHASALQLDTARLVLIGSSAGGLAVNYLTWVYHQHFPELFTPRGIVYVGGQLNYAPPEDFAVDLFVEAVGPAALLSDFMTQEACGQMVQNQFCQESSVSDYNVCNESYNEEGARFCGEDFPEVTLGQVQVYLRWPEHFGANMTTLWHGSRMRQMPGRFHLYQANTMNGTSFMNMPHHAIYAEAYAHHAAAAGVEHTVYNTDYADMAPASRTSVRVASTDSLSGDDIVFNYRSSHHWRSSSAAETVPAASVQEQVMYAAFALGLHQELQV